MENKKFTKEYPKAFCDKTVFNVNGFLLYHRRENKRVVPYNTTLSKIIPI